MKKTTISFFIALLTFSNLFAQSNLQLDHIFILVDSGTVAHLELEKAGLTHAKKWQTPHPQQGTTGEFYFFLNFYFEFLIVNNPKEANANLQNFGSDYVSRSKWVHNKSFPFGLGFVKKDTASIPFPIKTYHAEWMGEGNNLQMATSNQDLQEPLIFVEPMVWANQIYESREALEKAKNPDVKTYRTNSLGVEKLTKVVITVPKKKKEFSETLKALAKIPNIEIKSGKKPLIELEFDNKKSGKQINFATLLHLIIKY